MNSYETSGDLLTFVFADLAGFTALTEAHGDERAAVLATEFNSRIRDRAPRFGGEVVKTIGDAAMIRCEDAGAAIELGLSIIEEEGDRLDFPAIRIGMHSGVATEREGDWFGNTVNVAARVAAVAAAGEVVLTRATFDLRGELEDIVFERLGLRNLKNVGDPIVLFRASRKGAHDAHVTIDPVCRMRIAEYEWVGSLAFEGRTFRFCSMKCAGLFAANPRRYSDEVVD